MSSDWAKHLIGLKQKELEDKRLRDKKDLSDREMLEAHSMPMWNEVRSAVYAAIEELNKGMGIECLTFVETESLNGVGADPYRFAIRDGSKMHNVSYEKARVTIFSVCGALSYRLSVIERNGVVWKGENETQATSDQIARKIVAKAFLPKT